MALHPVCFGKGRQSQNDPDIQIGKDMIIHPDFMTSSQPVSFCAPKVWYLVEMLLNKRVAWCPLDLTRQAVVAASPSLKQAGVPDPSTIWMHHSGKIWTQETEDAFFHTLSGQLTGSVVSSGFIIGSLLERNKKALSLFWHGWSVQKAMFFLWMQLSTTTFSESVKLCATVYTCTVFILACGRESYPCIISPVNSPYLCSANSASGNFWWMQDGTSSYQEVFQAESFKIWVLWNFTSEDTSGVLIVARVVECGFWWPVMIVENHIYIYTRKPGRSPTRQYGVSRLFWTCAPSLDFFGVFQEDFSSCNSESSQSRASGWKALDGVTLHVPLEHGVTLHVWACVKYVPKQSIP